MKTTIISSLLLLLIAAATVSAQQSADTPGAGLNALSDDRLMSELSGRGMKTLLDRTFDVNKVTPEKRDIFKVLDAIRRLRDDQKLTNRQRNELVQEVVKGIDNVLTNIKDPSTLNETAVLLLTSAVERDVNTLEYWGENPRTQAQLKPAAEAVIRLLDKTIIEAEAAANALAARIQAPQGPLVNQWQKMDQLMQQSQYNRNMAVYNLAIALPADSSERQEIAQKAIDFLKEFDNADSTVQPVVRLRIAKLNMAKGDYDQARKLFASIINKDPNDAVNPEPGPFQQWEARYFNAVTDVLANKPADAQKSLTELVEWQKTSLGVDLATKEGKAAHDSVSAAADMLQYRVYSLAGDNDKAVAVLLALVEKRKDLKGIIFEQLIGKQGGQDDFAKMDPMMLQALVGKGEGEILKGAKETIDKKMIEKAIAAAKELTNRKDASIPADTIESSALLIGYMYNRLDQKVEAGNAFLDFVQKFPTSKKAPDALDAAQALIGELRNPKLGMADDQKVTALYDRFLPIAISKPFERKIFSYEYARLLQKQGGYSKAAEYFRLVPPDDKRFLQSRVFLMLALKQQLDDDKNKLAEADRQKVLSEIQQLADQINKAAAEQLASADDKEKPRYRLMLVRTSLMAADIARREQKDPNRVLELLANFENSVQGLPGENDLLGEALFLRVQSFMAVGKNTEATQELVKLLEKTGGAKGPTIIFGLLTKLNEDLDAARKAGNRERTAELAKNRAVLSGFLVNWAEKHEKEEVRKLAPQYKTFDAASKHLAAQLEEDPAAKTEALNKALAVYKTLPQDQPQVMLGIGLIQYDLGNYAESQKMLGSLLDKRQLGTPTITEQAPEGDLVVKDNDQYWEAMFKLFKSNVELAKENKDDALLEMTKTGLKRNYVQWGDKVGGKKWSPEFDQLRQQIVPDFDPKNLGGAPSTTQPVTLERLIEIDPPKAKASLSDFPGAPKRGPYTPWWIYPLVVVIFSAIAMPILKKRKAKLAKARVRARQA